MKDNSLIWFQYKVIYRLIGVKHYLHKIGLSSSPTCILCHENEETLYHLFVSCEESSCFQAVIIGNWELETPNYLVNILLQINIIFSNVYKSL